MPLQTAWLAGAATGWRLAAGCWLLPGYSYRYCLFKRLGYAHLSSVATGISDTRNKASAQAPIMVARQPLQPPVCRQRGSSGSTICMCFLSRVHVKVG